MERLDAVLGMPLILRAGLHDEAGLLNARETRQVKRALVQFCGRFPQVHVAFLIKEPPTVVPLRTWTFWLFNRGHFSTALDKGFVNRDMLLVLDPVARRMALTVGYGLEPFVGQRDLSAALDSGRAALEAGDWAEACCQVLVALDHGLQVIIGRMPRTYGVPMPLLLLEQDEPVAGGSGW
ncbi:MAG: Psb32 and founding protein of phosphatase [Verrucomicrobiales bacterium]|nr:Psb32 and founding protein of phosphatase [Verrucomicrobiales bacterium]